MYMYKYIYIYIYICVEIRCILDCAAARRDTHVRQMTCLFRLGQLQHLYCLWTFPFLLTTYCIFQNCLPGCMSYLVMLQEVYCMH